MRKSTVNFMRLLPKPDCFSRDRSGFPRGSNLDSFFSRVKSGYGDLYLKMITQYFKGIAK